MHSSYRFFEDGPFVDRRPDDARPGKYWARPASALVSSSQLIPGEAVWHVYLWSALPPRKLTVERVGTLVELEGPSLAAEMMGDRKWFTSAEERRSHSCSDCSLDGADTNNNYLFASEQDALDSVANKTPRFKAAS